MTQKSTIDKVFQRSSIALTLSSARSADRVLLKANDSFSAMTGYASEECTGRDCRFLQCDDRDQPGRFELRKALSEQQDIEVVLRNYTKAGREFENLLFIHHIRDSNGEVLYVLGSQFEIRNHLSAAKLTQHLNMLEADFVSLARSHRTLQYTVRRQLSASASTMLHSAVLHERIGKWAQG